MDAARSELDFQPEIVDRLHLLMDQETAISSDHIVNIIPESSPNNGPEDVRNIPESSSNNSRIPNDEGAIPNPSTSQEMALSASLTGPNQASLRASTVRRLASLGRNSNGNIYGARQRRSPLNSGAWVSVELLAIMSQIVASIVVLSISRDEKPRTPLATWIICYAVGCFGTLPLLYWRYTHRYPRQPIQDLLTPPIISPSGSSRHQAAASSASSSALFQDEETNARLASFRANQLSRSRDLRLGILMERFKIGLDCFFAVWFVTGNVWVFGGHSSASVAPNIYRLCIVFLAISCIGYAMPFILCATICCCLPCIIALIGHQEDHGQAKGATSEVIRALPTYKFKAKQCTESKGVKEGNDSDGEGSGEGGFVAFGTDKERAVSPDDAACCICLGKYKDGADLRELPCTHFFHTKCVDEWLGINASCPLCKHEITSHNLE